MMHEVFSASDIGEVEALVEEFSIDRVILDVQYMSTPWGWKADVFYIDIV